MDSGEFCFLSDMITYISAYMGHFRPYKKACFLGTIYNDMWVIMSNRPLQGLIYACLMPELPPNKTYTMYMCTYIEGVLNTIYTSFWR